MRQQLRNFVDVRALSSFVQQQQQLVQCARIVAYLRNHSMQAAQQFARVGCQQPIGMPRINVERFVILPETCTAFCQQKQSLGIVMHRQQLLCDRSSLGQSSNLQVRLQQVAQSLGMRVEVGRLLQILYGAFRIVAFQCGFPAQQQNVAVSRVKDQHALQNVFSGGQRAPPAQRLCRRSENLPGFFLFSQPYINLGQLHPHRHVFRVHFEDLLEKPYRLFQVAILHEIFGDLQILSARVVKQPLLRVEFRQFQRYIQARLQLGDLFVHGDALDREALRGIRITHRLKALDSFGGVAHARIKIANGIVDSKIFWVVLEDFVVLSNGVLQLALLDKLFRGAENLLFVEAKTKRHKMRTPAFSRSPPARASSIAERVATLVGRFPDETPPPARPTSQSMIAE